MGFLNHASLALVALTNTHRAVRCFDLSAKGQNEKALQVLLRTRARVANNPHAPWDLELQLLQSYLYLDSGRVHEAQKVIRGAFRRIKASGFNRDEKAVFVRYATSVLWHARGRQPSCLLLIRHGQTFDASKVRGNILRNFPNPDEVD